MATTASEQATLGLDADEEPTAATLPYNRAEAVHVLRQRGYRFPEHMAAIDQAIPIACLTEAMLVGRDRALPDLNEAQFLLLFARLLLAHGMTREGPLAEAVAGLIEAGALVPAEVGLIRAAYRAYGQDRIADAIGEHGDGLTTAESKA